MNNFDKILFGLIFLCFVLGSYSIYLYFAGCSSCQMYSYKNETKFGIDGIYFDKQYYCVWTGHSNYRSRDDSIIHELCHHSISLEKEHFCSES